MDLHRIVEELLAYCVHTEPTFRSSESLSAYERQRLENMRRNQAYLFSLGLVDRPSLAPPPPPRQPRVPKRDRPPVKPTRRSDRQASRPAMYEPEEIRERRPIRHPRLTPRIIGVAGGHACPSLEGYDLYDGCSSRSRARHMLSRTKRYADIDPAVREEVLAQFGGDLPRREDGTFQFVQLIEKHGHWHYRASFERLDYGSFCEAKLASFVSCYARLYRKSREEVWQDLGIVNLDDLPEDCLASSESQSPASSLSLRPRRVQTSEQKSLVHPGVYLAPGRG